MKPSSTTGPEDALFHASTDSPLEFLLALTSDVPRELGSLSVTISTISGTKLINADSIITGKPTPLAAGRTTVRVLIDSLHLTAGLYRVGLWAADPIRARTSQGHFDLVESAFKMIVVNVRAPRIGVEAAYDGAVPCRIQVDAIH